MSDTILSGDLTVYYLAENRRKQVRWTGGAGKDVTRTLKAVYAASQDLMTQPAQTDDGVVFSAETPGEYTIGKIDAGDTEPWFIDLMTMQHLVGDYANFTGCALKTSGWTRVVGSNAGIVVVAITHSGSTIVAGDIGYDITHGDGDAGTLLDVIVTGGATDYLFIRPDSSASANNFDSTSGTLTCNAHTATQSAAAVTGEMIWGNAYTQGALQEDTHLYIFQNGSRVTAYNSTTEDWWPDGHLDRAIPITDFTASGYPVIDNGYLTVYARKYGTTFGYAIIRMNTTSGGNVSAPIVCDVDSNNTTGYASITLSGGSGNWNVGDEISGDTSGARAIITQIVGANPTPTLHFYYIGDPLTAFNGSEAITNEDDTGAATGSGAVANQGPALSSWFDGSAVPTIAFANTTADIDDDATDEPYGITIDCNQASLAQVYQWLKYVQRRGSVTDLDGLDGQEWIGIDYRVNYTGAVTGTVGEGSTVTGVTSGATAIVVSHDTTNKVLLLRNSRGSFQNAEQIQVDGSNYIPATGTTVAQITPVSANSFGTLAGGIFFGSTGVLLSDYKLAEQNSFELKDANGVTRARPTSITMTISNLAVGDWAACYRLTGAGGDVNKAEYSAAGGESAGDATLVVDSAIAVDVPGKTLGGRLVLVDANDGNREYVLRYASWASATFTLANTAGTAEAGTDTDTIVDTGVFTAANVQVGDLIYNSTRNAVAYVVERTDDDTVQISPPITGQTTGDSFEINCIPITVAGDDAVYVPIILSYVSSGTTKSASMTYLADIYGRTRVRNTADAATKIKPFTSDVTIGSTGGATVAVRTPDLVYG